MTFPALKEAQGKLDAKRKELHDIFAEAGEDIDFAKVKCVKGTSREIAAHVRQLNDEQADLAKEVEDYLATQKAAEQQKTRNAGDAKGGRESGDDRTGGAGGGRGAQTKTLGELFVESKAYTDRKGTTGPQATIDVELKALMESSTGFEPESTRTGRVVPFATRPIQVAELIPQTTTGQNTVKYMEETVYVNNAAEVAEGQQYPEAELKFDERESTVRKISVFLPVTEEQLDDAPQVRGLVDNRLMFMVRQRLDLQIISGNGTSPNLRGMLNTVGIKTQAKGSDPTPDAIYKAITLAQVEGQCEPNVVMLHPYAWQGVRLLRTADGIYIWGNPSDAGPDRIWGLQVVKAQVLPAPAGNSTGIVADLPNFTELSVRRGIDVQVSNSHGTFFVEGKLAVRADMRAAFVVYRPAAICTVTGLPTT